MAFADPQSITIDGSAHSLPRQYDSTGMGKFVEADGTYQLEILPRQGKSTKTRTLRLRNSKVTSDPLVSSTNVRVNNLVTLTIIRPLDGYSDAEIVKQVAGLCAWLTASTNANLTKFVAGEN